MAEGNKVRNRREAKVKALELITQLDFTDLFLNEVQYSSGGIVETDRDIEYMIDAMSKEQNILTRKLYRLKVK